MKLSIFSFLFLGTTLVWPQEHCEIDYPTLARSEQKILSVTTQMQRQKNHFPLLQIQEPLQCILKIQEKAEGSLKLLANSFLRPLLGGPQNPGVPADARYQILARELTKLTAHAPDLMNSSIPAAHARGRWSFYALFCAKGNLEFCVDFLPNAEQINVESPVLAASSLMVLRQAYHSLKGNPREQVAARIKELYLHIPMDGSLKRKVIEQIYTEIFSPSIPLSLLS